MRPGLGVGVEASGGAMKRSGSHSLLHSGHCQISIISSLIYKVDERPTTSLDLFRDTWQLKKKITACANGMGLMLSRNSLQEEMKH